MSEPTLSILISAGVLIVLALLVPCMESLARLFRRREQKRDGGGEAPAQTYGRDIA